MCDDVQRSAPPLSRAVLAFALATLLLASGAAADFWYEHYDEAQKALNKGEWAEAIEQLQQALERKGDSQARARTYGLHFVEYFPHLDLGVAYFELGRVEAALQAFETEELLGAIERSDKAKARLADYRSRARRALDDAAQEEQRERRRILAQSLDEAADLEARGLLDEAMSALGRGLSVVPDDSDALAALERLRQKAAAAEEAREIETERSDWLERGRNLLASDKYGEAVTAFRRAQALRPGSDAASLLTTAQRRLQEEAAKARSEQDAAERAATIDQRLRSASDREARGDLDGALDDLQAVITLDPTNEAALAAQSRIFDARASDQRDANRRARIQELLSQAEVDFKAGRSEAALAAAQQVLALDPADATALSYVLRAYQTISRGLLGGGAQNLPPAIQFADFREDLADGSRRQDIENARFRLSGMIIDESPVTVAFVGRGDRELPGQTQSRERGGIVLTEFTLDTRLVPGVTDLRLTATDLEGISVSSVYSVRYAPPFFRTPAFYGAVGAAFAALVGGVLWSRHRRRQRLLKRRFNPYIAGAPVLDEDLFLGRDGLIERILQTVHNNSLLLHGERRIGKTSLQHHLKRRLEGLDDPIYEFFPVYTDLQGIPEDMFFATLAEDVFQELAPKLEGVTSRLQDGVAYTYRDLVRDLRQVIKALAAQTPKKVKLVLLIDEVDELNEYDPKINQRLRSLFMKSFAESLVSVVSGVAIKKQWEREGSPWYNFFEEIEVKGFRREDAEALIERPIQGIFKLEEGVVDRIIELTDCKPYLIQKLCIAWVNKLHEEGRRTLTVADIEALGRPEAA